MKLNTLNINEMFNPAFQVTNTEIVDKDNNFLVDGLYSEAIFGAMNSSDMFEYSCLCKETVGKFFVGMTCPDCGHTVKKSESLIERLGWIKLNRNIKVISPYFWMLIEKIIGPSNLDKIVNIQVRVNLEGKEIFEENSNFHGYGYQFLVDNLLTVLEKYQKDDKVQYTKFIIDNWEKVFHTVVPVISSKLRPARMNGSEIAYDEVNNYYMRILNINKTIENLQEEERSLTILNPLLFTMQEMYNNISDYIINALSGKGGWFRNSFLSNRLNLSSRCVITPLPATCDIDEVHLPYLCCLELLKFQIINVLINKNGGKYSYAKALDKWSNALIKFDEEIYTIVQDELIGKSYYDTTTGVRQYGIHILVNRNPTINKGSILLCRLTKIKEDMLDLTMSLSNNILSLLAGD